MFFNQFLDMRMRQKTEATILMLPQDQPPKGKIRSLFNFNFSAQLRASALLCLCRPVLSGVRQSVLPSVCPSVCKQGTNCPYYTSEAIIMHGESLCDHHIACSQ